MSSKYADTNENNKFKLIFIFSDVTLLFVITAHLNAACTNHTDCNEIRFAMCSARNRCICGNNYIAINEKICATAIGGFCFFDQECADINSMCIDHYCQCKLTALLSANNQCVPSKFL